MTGVDALANRTTQVYDAAGQRVALVDANAKRTTFTFDEAGRNTRVMDPLGNRTTFSFDAAGQRALRVDARGNRTTYVYQGGRLRQRRYPDGTRVTFTYSRSGLRTVLHDWTGRTTLGWDKVGRLWHQTTPAGKRTTYGYDGTGQRTLLVEPEGGRFTYAYDDAGRMDHIANPQGERTTWQYNASRVTTMTLANGTRATYVHDAADRLLKLANLKSDGSVISSFAYAYDAVGNRSRVVEADGNRVTWTYDKKYQLTRERRSGANSYDITYTYDPVGNRDVKIDGGARSTYTYDGANELLTLKDVSGTTTFTYDADGNQLTKKVPAGGLTTNTWDYENKLTRVALPSGTRNTFTYNADGLRVEKQDSSGTARFLWDLENVLLETDASDVTQVIYTLEPAAYGNLVSQRRSGTTSYFHFDALGSTDRLTSGAETVTDTYAYDAWGNIVASSGNTVNPFRYVGLLGYYYEADLAKYYLRARTYDPTRGRFLSPDPFRPLLEGNMYSAFFSSPSNLRDPSGEVCEEKGPQIACELVTIGEALDDQPPFKKFIEFFGKNPNDEKLRKKKYFLPACVTVTQGKFSYLFCGLAWACRFKSPDCEKSAIQYVKQVGTRWRPDGTIYKQVKREFVEGFALDDKGIAKRVDIHTTNPFIQDDQNTYNKHCWEVTLEHCCGSYDGRTVPDDDPDGHVVFDVNKDKMQDKMQCDGPKMKTSYKLCMEKGGRTEVVIPGIDEPEED